VVAEASSSQAKEINVTQKIHSSAIIEQGAVLGDDVTIGPFCYVGEHVRLGNGCHLHSHASVVGYTDLADEVELFTHSVLGQAPQVIGYKPSAASKLIVGARSVFREMVSVHTGFSEGKSTTEIGTDCYMMANTHLGHDVIMGNKVVIANGTQIGGHVEIGNNVWFGGLAAVHQFTRIGRNAFVGGGAIVVEDIIPFGSVIGNRAHLAGLNVVGLKRNGFSKADVRDIRAAYKLIFLESGQFADRLQQAEQDFVDQPLALEVLSFIRESGKRAICKPERTK
jgi:UDP-N-acetylglucosamine acyltransferase